MLELDQEFPIFLLIDNQGDHLHRKEQNSISIVQDIKIIELSYELVEKKE